MKFKYKFKTFAKMSIIDVEQDKDLQKEVASHIDVSPTSQPDLLYFKAVYLSEGANKNGAFFSREELVKSVDTIYNKGMDIEHVEHDIVGHIYAAAFASSDGQIISKEDVLDFDGDIKVVIGGIVYRDRFPELSEEIEAGEWFVSMETYYKDFFITVGADFKLTRDSEDIESLLPYVGRAVKVTKDGTTIANGNVNKHLIGLHFCGGGFVKKPAEPTAIIFETASETEDVVSLKSKKKPAKQKKTVPEIVIVASQTDANDEEIVMDIDQIKAYIDKYIAELECASKVNQAVAELESFLDEFDVEFAAKWTRAYINKLPDSAFVIIEPAYKQGKTDNKNARHLPYKDDKGKVDLPHLRNAAARCSQIKAVTDSITTEELRKRACKKVQSLVKKYLKK